MHKLDQLADEAEEFEGFYYGKEMEDHYLMTFSTNEHAEVYAKALQERGIKAKVLPEGGAEVQYPK